MAPAPAPVTLPERDPATRRSRLKPATKIIWLVAVVLLVCDALAFGVDSWATGLADVGVLVLTVVVFLVSSDAQPATPPAPGTTPASESSGPESRSSSPSATAGRGRSRC